MKECVVILGMHRSGTSVLSGMVSLQGYYIGSDEMPAREDNPKGFFENMKIYRFNQAILEACHTSWDTHFFTFDQIPLADLHQYEEEARAILIEEFSLVRRIFIKDPRMCLLFPLWEKVLQEMGFDIKVILAYRSPMEVAYSLKSRNNIAIEKSILMWSHYFFQAEKSSRSYKRMIVQYDKDFYPVDTFFEALGKFTRTDLDERMYVSANELYSPTLKHHQLQLNNLSDHVPAYLKDFISILQQGKINQSEQLDLIRDEFYYSKRFYLYNEDNQRNKINSLEDKIAELKKNTKETEEELRIARLNASNKAKEIKAGMARADERVKETKMIADKKLVAAHSIADKKLIAANSIADKKLIAANAIADEKLIAANAIADEKLRIANLNASNKAKEILAANLRANERVKEAQQTAKKILEASNQAFNKKIKSANHKVTLKLKEISQFRGQADKEKKKYSILQQQCQRLKKDIRSSEESLSIASEVFYKVYKSRRWHKKLGRIIQGQHPFNLKKITSPWMKKNQKKLLQEKTLIIDSGLFSLFYYLTNNPDVWYQKVDPLSHFCQHGWKQGRNPNPNFHIKAYLSMYKDVARTGVNPLLHYIKFGKSEGRLTILPAEKNKKKSNLTHLNSSSTQPHYTGETKGKIDTFKEGIVSGSFMSKDSLPVIKVNGIPNHQLEIELKSNRFTAAITTSVNHQTTIELLSLSEAGISPLQKKHLTNSPWITPDKYADLEKAALLCKDPNTVAITVWEGAHNPIGRAKVLYDIVTTKRPAIIFAYIFDTFGEHLWGPLRASGIQVVLIPYKERLAYHRYFQESALYFNTIWICKHRLHSFELASMLCDANTACILDIDDNEDVFVRSKNSESQPYGIFSKNKADYFLNKISTRSVASASLLKNYGGMLMRHARKKHPSTLIATTNKTKTAVFIGTIRPHKNITQLVRAVSHFNQTASDKINLVIGGDFNPISLKQTLKTPDTTILDEIHSDDLFNTLAKFDVLITGYPDTSLQSIEINKFQITSKIGDGLAVGRPVLTPYSPAVADLTHISGLFIFTQQNFTEKLKQAIAYKGKVVLPEEFTLEYSYKTFETLETQAKSVSLASTIFTLEALYSAKKPTVAQKKNIVLIWKQHDAGIYGRRIDHIARYYKQQYPDCNITIVEAMTERQIKTTLDVMPPFDNSTTIVNEVLEQKIYQYEREGVNYRLISYSDDDTWNSFENKFNHFLSTESIHPYNTVMILFPLHQVFNTLLNIMSNYKVIIDLVDNQINWITTPEGRVKGLKQYYNLLSIANKITSNSPKNIEYFRTLGFFNTTKPQVIANWYTLPSDCSFQRAIDPNEINLIYSGNMNDRIDWQLLKDICKVLAKFKGNLHIAGSTIRRAEEMQALLNEPNCIYHGVVKEEQLLTLLQHMNFAVIPHIEDKISKFMDPIKLKMYAKLGIPSLITKLPGLATDNPLLTIAESPSDFLHKLEKWLTHPMTPAPFNDDKDDKIGKKYIHLINELLYPALQ